MALASIGSPMVVPVPSKVSLGTQRPDSHKCLTMGFEESCCRYIKTSFPICFSNQLCLHESTRLGNATTGVTVLICTDRSDQSSNGVSVSQGFRDWLQDKNAKPLSSTIAVGSMIEAIASAIG
jgi:hypothetical protein